MRKLYGFLLGVLLCSHAVVAQTKEVTGKITDSQDGSPLPGVTVKAKGTNISTSSQADGSFRISIPESTTLLVFTYVGYNEIELPVSGLMNVQMSLSNTLLNEVVVTGYTTIQRKKFSAATVVVDVKEVRQQPFGSFDQALQGQGAGISVVANSGQPGANAIVRIRGYGSISGGNVPLYIVDGIEVNAADFSSLNQGDFDRVEVLKDATATAIYGSRGANGVIVITTRKGRAGQLQLNYDAQVGFSKLPKDRLEVMNSDEKITYELQRGNPYGWSPAEADSLRTVSFNWTDALFQTGVTHQHMLSASGGSQTSRFFASLSYMDQEGIVQTTGLKRYTARINVDNNIRNWRFGVNLQGGYSKLVGTRESDAYIGSPLNAIRWSNPYERDRDPVTGEYQQLGGTGVLVSGQPNAAMELFENDRWSLQFKAIGSAYLEFHFPFLKGFYARTNWGGDFTQNEGSLYYNRTTYTGSQANGGNGSLGRSQSRNFRYTGTTSLNYKNTFGDHEIEGGVYTEVVKNNSRNFGFTGYGLTNGFANETGITAGNGTNGYIPAVGGGGSQSGIQSFFTLINYGYQNKYYLTMVGRRDGSSRFGVNNRYANFGSVGVTWVVSEENFMANSQRINDLRLRASIGTNGNNNTSVGDFGHLPLFGRTTYNGVSGWGVATPGNFEYRWEVNRTINIGVDFAAFSSRLSGTVEVYDRRTNNLFYNQPVSMTTGFGSVPGNDGTLRNRGIELTLRGDIVKTRDFRFTITANATYNQNEIIALPEDSVVGGTTILAIGKPLNSFYLVEYAGVNAANGNALYYDLEGKLTQTYDPGNRRIYGSANAPWFGGISTTIVYKGFELSAQLNFFLDRDVYNNDRVNLTNPAYFFDNMSVDVLKEWQNPGDITDVPRPTSSGGNSFQSNTTRFLEDGSFWRLRNITLGYTVPSRLLDRVGIKSARLFVQGQNLWTQTNFRSFDPENSNPVLVGAQYPALVQTTIGLSIGF